MAFCDKEKQLIDSGMTCIDNKFILNYMPDAPDKCVAVYLLGLALSESNGTDNSCETVAQKLNLTPEEVVAAYRYWEELGLVHISFDDPKTILYLNVRGKDSTMKKIKPSKYMKFNTEMQTAYDGRMMTPNELYEYYEFLESTTFEPEALVAVAKYCTALKGNSIHYKYVLTVARNLLQKGCTTLVAVQDTLNSQQKYDEDLKLVFKAMSLSRKIDHQDRELYEKWTKDFGFTQDVIVKIAKRTAVKKIEKLDAMLCEYYKKGVFAIAEIENYEQQKEHLVELAKQVNRNIGVYYQSVDVVIDEYLIGWLHRGYNDETLLAVAKYCFRSGIRTLQGMASIIDKLYKNGITTIAALDEYLLDVAQKDGKIKVVLERAGLERNVTNNDRALYKTWNKWAMPDDVICFVAEKSAGTSSPMAYINKVLADYKQKGIFTLAQAQAEAKTVAAVSESAGKRAIIGKDLERPTYTDEQLNSLFTALDEGDD